MTTSNIVSLIVVFTLVFLVFYVQWVLTRFFRKSKEDILEILNRLETGLNRVKEDAIEITKEGEIKK
jgi:hypothetical protein